MKLKHIQIIFIIAFLFLIFSSGTGVKEDNRNVPKMVIDQMFHYYGDINRGEILSHSFVVRNEEKGDLNIKSAKPD